MKKYLQLISLWAAAGLHFTNAQAATINVNGNLNNAPITQVTYLVDDNPVIQNTPAAVNTVVATGIFVNTITLNDGGSKTLQFYNSVNAVIRNDNFVSNTGTGGPTGGVGVYNTSAPTRIRIQDSPPDGGLVAFEQAVIDSSTNTNLMNYMFYDGSLNNMPPANTADFDILFYNAWTTSDYLVVAERNGNTNFELVPLGVDGSPIADANTLRFGDASPNYDWNSGFVNANDLVTGQPMWFSAVNISKFFEGTTVPIGDQLVYGFRIDNNGNADVKFFGASNDPFTNNPINPIVPIPEPSSLVLLLAASAAFLYRRRRS